MNKKWKKKSDWPNSVINKKGLILELNLLETYIATFFFWYFLFSFFLNFKLVMTLFLWDNPKGLVDDPVTWSWVTGMMKYVRTCRPILPLYEFCRGVVGHYPSVATLPLLCSPSKDCTSWVVMVCGVQVFVSLHPPVGCRGRVGNVLSVMSHRVSGSIHFDGGFPYP